MITNQHLQIKGKQPDLSTWYDNDEPPGNRNGRVPVKNYRGPFDQRETTNCALQVLYVKKTSKNEVEYIQRFLIFLALQP